MRSSTGVLFLVSIIGVSIPVLGQTTSSSISRDPLAVDAVQRAISATGGSATASVRDATVNASGQVTAGAPSQTAVFIWEDSWSTATPAFRRETHLGESTAVLVSGNGRPLDFEDGIVTEVPAYVSLSCMPFHLPGIVLAREFNQGGYILKFVEQTAINGLAAIHIQMSLPSYSIYSALSVQDWFFDANSGLPLRVIYRIATSADVLHPGTATMDFADYRVVSNVLVPFRLTESGLNGESDVVTVTSVVLNAGLNTAEFEAPIGSGQ